MAENFGSTIYDVAARSGVSISTVSRFLNAPVKVNPDTALKIKTAMEQLAYIRHGNAGTRSSRQVGRVGVLSPFFPAVSFMQRMQGIAEVLRKADYELIIYSVDSLEQLEKYVHSCAFSRRLDGLIVMAMAISDENAKRLQKSGLQVVLIEQHSSYFSCIECDNVRGGALAAEHFLSKDYSPLGYIGQAEALPYSLQPSRLRLKGFRDSATAAGKPISDDHIRLGLDSVLDAQRMARELLSLRKPPRAIFAMSDLQAFGVIKAAREFGLRIPQDVAVLGFDDIEAADYMELSTISQSLNESGRLAAELLVGRIKEPGRPLQSVQLKVSVVERSTS